MGKIESYDFCQRLGHDSFNRRWDGEWMGAKDSEQEIESNPRLQAVIPVGSCSDCESGSRLNIGCGIVDCRAGPKIDSVLCQAF
jgi:hypothetical protein